MSGLDAIARGLAAQALGAVRPAAYAGLVATRLNVPSLVNASYRQLGFRRFHVARDDVAALRVAFPNWVANNNVGEGGTGGTATFAAAIERVDGGVQPFAWAGAATSAPVPDGGQTPLSDPLALARPLRRGEWFAIRGFAQFAGGAPFSSLAASTSAAGGDAIEFAASGLADKTLSGTIGTNTGLSFGPCLLVAQTRRPSVALFGDSRLKGGSGTAVDAADGSGDLGEIARSIGPAHAYLNMGTASETLQAFLGNCARRLALSGYASHVLCNYGVNDLLANRTAAQLLADVAGFAALPALAGRPVSWATIGPRTTSTDAWATIANQSAFGQEAQRVAVNDALRARRVAGLADAFDVAAAYESGVNSGRHAAGPGGQAITTDGLHLNAIGMQIVRQSRAIEPGRFAR